MWRKTRGVEQTNSGSQRFLAETLAGVCPRPIPVWLEGLETVISYSDGKGAKAGLEIAVWSSRCPAGPLAAFCEIPDRIRDLWDRRGAAERNDIVLVEAIGPLAILEPFTNILKKSL